MTALLARVLGRMPIGWLQLTHNRSRLAAALAGIAFANILVFVQLGILGALNESIVSTYRVFDGDIMISSSSTNTLSDGANVPRVHMFEALAVPGVQSASPVMIGAIPWSHADGTQTSFQVIGVVPSASDFYAPPLGRKIEQLSLPGSALIDVATRGADREALEAVSPSSPLPMELSARWMQAVDTLHIGGGFAADGTLVVSDQTFLRLFSRRSSGAPDHVLVKVEPGVHPQVVVQRLREALGDAGLKIRTVQDAAADDQRYQTTQKPTGLIFGFGVIMGVIVGIIIVYQILSTDVADHLREYATFKAMGYPQSFFVAIILEEAIVLAVLGFIPGLGVGWGLCGLLAKATGLPVTMVLSRAVLVLLGTAAACTLSGALATRRLAGSDPADLF
ncbi:MAG: ABC transporter permease DevC [Nannocystaceae bacterium]